MDSHETKNDDHSELANYELPDDGSRIKESKERLSNAKSLRRIHANLVEADSNSEKNRAKVQDLKDHKPPLRQDLLNARGQSSRFNINFGETGSIINEAEAGYIDAFVSPEHLVPIRLDRTQVTGDDKTAWERILSDEYTKMIRGWDSGLFTYMTMVDQFVTHGVAIGYFKDNTNWQWHGAGLREFKFPRRTKASADSVEIATCEAQMGPAELADNIDDEAVAASLGWNVAMVKRVINKSSGALYDDESDEDSQEKAKANDFDEEGNPYKPINVVYGWVKEMDGSVSMYITTKDDIDSELEERPMDDYLFKSHKAYDSISQAMYIFPFLTGNKGNIYSIRGLGFMAYPQGMASNLMQCALLDSAKDSMSVKYTSPSEKAMTQAPIVNAGPYSFVPASLTPVADQKAPDLQRSAMPALELLQNQMDRKSVSSTMSSVFNNAPDRRSKTELTAALEHFNSLNSGAMLLWSHPWRGLMVESASRAFASDQNDQMDSGKAAKRMQQACIDRGVPREAFKLIDWHETKTSIPAGPGSKAARAARFQEGGSLYSVMDVPGRMSFDRDRAIDIFGVEKAREYINFEDVPREIVDHKLAELENNDLVEGTPMQPSPSENFLVHLDKHVARLTEYIQQVEKGDMELVPATEEMYQLYLHVVATYEMAVVPEVLVPELQQFKQAIQQIGEYVNNGIRQIEKEEREAQDEAQASPEGGEQSPEQMKAQIERERAIQKMQIDAAAASEKLRQNAETHAQSLIINREKALNEMAIADAKGAQSISKS